MSRISVNSNDEITIDLEPKKNYYLDWYSDDYVITNWLNTKTIAEPLPAQTFYADTTIHSFNITIPDSVTQLILNRRLLLNGNKVSQIWKAVAFYGDFGFFNTFDQLPNYLKVLEFTFQKDFSMYMHYQDSTSADINAKASMKIYYEKFKLAFTNSSYIKGEIFTTSTGSFDTLEFHITDFGVRRGNYKLVRE